MDGRSRSGAADTNAPRARPLSSARGSSDISWYARQLARSRLLSPSAEVRAAEEIREAELEFWLAVLSDDLGVRWATELVPAALPERGTADGAASGRAPENVTQDAEPSRAQAEVLRRRDTNREGLREVWCRIGRLPQKARSARCRSTSLADYRERVRRAFVRQADAKRRFARMNLRLVVMIARQHDRGALPLEDLIQEGNIGLMTAVERFDVSRGLRFSTYAGWWIRHAIRRAIADKSRTVRVPVHRQDLARQAARVAHQTFARTGRVPSSSAVSRELGVPERRLIDLEGHPVQACHSLDQPLTPGTTTTFLDTLADRDLPSPDDALVWGDFHVRLSTSLGELSPIEARVVRARFGLDGGEVMTLESLGHELNLSRERVRQIQLAAVDQLKRYLE